MLEFDEKFFEEEMRCGFVVSHRMKCAWAAEMEVLSEIIRICRKYNITYFAGFGTLLGAVRHKGYIPWDDDIDIALKREDYQKLLQILPQELPEGYHFSTLNTFGNHSQPLSCVMNSKKILTDAKEIKKFHGCPYIVGVDIFPLDYIPGDEEVAKAQCALYNVVYDAAYRCEELVKCGEMEKYLPQIEELCGITLDHTKPLKQQLWVLSDRISSMYREEEGDYLTWFPWTMYKQKDFRYKKEWFCRVVELPFENMLVSAPEKYDEVLTATYGDYHKPIRLGSNHDYPFYKKQEEFLKKMRAGDGS